MVAGFNLIPSHVIVVVALSGIGALPYAVRWLVEGEKPRRKDEFELFLEYKAKWDAASPFRPKTSPDAVEADWVAKHRELGNLEE